MPATLGGYELVQRIAVGGMAEVFLARKAGPEGFEKRVALKRILPHLCRQPDFVTMFLDEARLAARLDHAHVVQIYDFGVDGDTYYMAMEHVAGEELASLIRRAVETRRPIALEDAVTILVAACEALHYVHEQGIIHRDVTPSNLLVSFDGVVKLADFGIAKVQARARTTQAGTLKGKIPYMSPEQARGLSLDRRSDVYSLGVCAWELLTGRRLHAHESEMTMLKAVQAGVVPAISSRREIPRPLERMIERALAYDPDARFATCRELAQALTGWLAQVGAVPSASRLAETMAGYFGADAAARARAAEAPSDPTLAGGSVIADAPPRWRPMQLLPPLKLPRFRLLIPLAAILLSFGGLLYGLRTPRLPAAHLATDAAAARLAPLPRATPTAPLRPWLHAPVRAGRPPLKARPRVEYDDGGGAKP